MSNNKTERPTTVFFPSDLYHRFKVCAMIKKRTVKSVLIELVEEYVQKVEKEFAIKLESIPMPECRQTQTVLERDLVEDDPVGSAILTLTERWQEGEERRYLAKELLNSLEEVLTRKDPPGWPQTSKSLAKRLPRLQSALRSVGVELTHYVDPHRKQRVWYLRKEKYSESKQTNGGV